MQESAPNIGQVLDSQNTNSSDSVPKFKYLVNKKYFLILFVVLLASFIAYLSYSLWNFGTVKIGNYYINAWQPAANNEAYFHIGKSDRDKAEMEFSNGVGIVNQSMVTPTPTEFVDDAQETDRLVVPNQTYDMEYVLGLVSEIRDLVSENSSIESGKMVWRASLSMEAETIDAVTYWFSADNLDSSSLLAIDNYFISNNFEDLYGEIANEGETGHDYQKENVVCNSYFRGKWPEGFTYSGPEDKKLLQYYGRIECGLLK